MAVAFLFEGSGVTADKYDAVMRDIGRESLDSPGADGIIAHFAGPTATGWRVVDVWESEEHAGRFYGQEDFSKAISTHVPGIQPDSWKLHRIEVFQKVMAEGAASS